MRTLCDKVGNGKWDKPVYLAVTIPQSIAYAGGRDLVLEGTLYRVMPEPFDKNGGSQPEVDGARTVQLMRDEFRLDSATDFAFAWSSHSATACLMSNYAAILVRMAHWCAQQDDAATMRWAFRQALAIWSFHDQPQMVSAMAKYWQELDPDNDEIETWLQADR